VLAAALWAASGHPAHAQPRDLPLDPAHAEIGFRAYAFGVIPIDGVFSRFSGRLSIDPGAPDRCHVTIDVEVASLRLADPALREDALSEAMLDARDFPYMAYDGVCRGDGIEGTLTLHGTARPLRLSVTNAPPRYSADAAVRRRDWGIVGRPLLAGQTVRIRVSTTIAAPPAAAP